MYKITYNLAYSIIQSQFCGLLSVSDVLAYAAEVEPIILRCAASGSYRMLIDVSDCAIQPQAVIMAFQKHVASVPQAQRLAVITGNSIIRLQARRVLTAPHMSIYSTRAEGLAWLLNGQT